MSLHFDIFFIYFLQVFMSCNLISGMFQRLDKMRKAAFASVCLFGMENDSSISGIWVWRGHDLAFTVGAFLCNVYYIFVILQFQITITFFKTVVSRLAGRLRIIHLD